MRRLIDILFSATLLVVLSPLLVTLAIAVVMDSPGNPFYGGLRSGLHGRPFRMWKFRTMAINSDQRGSITGKNDSRVTRIGRLLRKTKLDELPQFMNVLLGDMTLVGPRPEALDIVARYDDAQRAILSVKPGVTGRVQLDSGDESQQIPEAAAATDYYVKHLMDGKLRRDLDYLKSRSPLSDTLIVLQTATLVFRHLVRH